jgi:hypothetical protein
MKKTTYLIVAVLAFACGYLLCEKLAKPKTIEIPTERIITRTKYVDKQTGKPVEVIKEETKFDSEAQLKAIIATTKKQSFVSISYGAKFNQLETSFYGVSYHKRVFKNVFVGATVYSNSSATVNLGFEF